ncbi:restriction endonuclease [Longibacter salinarum]|uniref:Restriction endonuclease n=1 Tax=Longibacter salinarum TaxID=1850348 RepID=A0A2A8D2H9_9BACT|nr:restriction endonuclease [Longibacter salinarum]PEN15136.1 restriction endonuclease [Longibacter salinarum]
MAQLYLKAERFHVNVLADDIDKELSGVAERFFDNRVHSGAFGNLNKSDQKNLRNDLATDANRVLQNFYIDGIRNLLSRGVRTQLSIDWSGFKAETGKLPPKPEKPSYEEIPEKPSKSEYEPRITLLDKLFKSRAERKWREMKDRYQIAVGNWKAEKEEIEFKNRWAKETYEEELSDWLEQKKQIERKKRQSEERLRSIREQYETGEGDAVAEVINTVLSSPIYKIDSIIPEAFGGIRSSSFDSGSKTLILDYFMPSPNDLINREEINYVKSRDVFKSKAFSKRNFERFYEPLPYQLALRTVDAIFTLDYPNNIENVVLNGVVDQINASTGHEETVCILSLQVSREEVSALNLEHVDAKACFRSLKGVAASKLIDVAPVTPIAQVDTSDSRFADSRRIGENMDDGENVASMDWEDFEHLIRELFEMEFSANGGEVNVTQASRDGGIDAVAIDPDPIRGGKVVIQAKRYTRTVGVSAVRDLYGTVMNEGANKGILVTTSDYGPDAYKFAKDKPLQLLNGGNLMSLLGKHGYNARLNLEEAREVRD